MKERDSKDCDRCHSRASDFVLYPEGVDPREFEAGDAESVCGHCVPVDAIRTSPFSFQVKGDADVDTEKP